MNKELYTEALDSKITVVNVEEERVVFTKENGSKITLASEHTQDCCEHVYADWSQLEFHKDAILREHWETLTIKAVEKMGILLCFEGRSHVKALVPCYDQQNGYYSSNLRLKITSGEKTTEVDISDYVEEHID